MLRGFQDLRNARAVACLRDGGRDVLVGSFPPVVDIDGDLSLRRSMTDPGIRTVSGLRFGLRGLSTAHRNPGAWLKRASVPKIPFRLSPGHQRPSAAASQRPSLRLPPCSPWPWVLRRRVPADAARAAAIWASRKAMFVVRSTSSATRSAGTRSTSGLELEEASLVVWAKPAQVHGHELASAHQQLARHRAMRRCRNTARSPASVRRSRSGRPARPGASTHPPVFMMKCCARRPERKSRNSTGSRVLLARSGAPIMRIGPA